MFNFNMDMFDVIIGMTFFYLLLSLLCSAIAELIETFIKKRAVFLEKGIKELLSNQDGKPDAKLMKRLYEHPLLYGLFPGKYEPKKDRKKLPSYIPASNFALALMDIVLNPENKESENATSETGSSENSDPETDSKVDLKKAISKYGKSGNPNIATALSTFVITAGDDVDKLQKSIEQWYDSVMERVSGWYKRWAQKILLGLALFASIAMNFDTITIATHLSKDKTLRGVLVTQAQEIVKQPEIITPAISGKDKETGDSITKSLEKLIDIESKIESLGLPIGWSGEFPTGLSSQFSHDSQDWWNWLKWLASHLIGWSATAIAVSFGAPFWFDILNRFIEVRSTLKPEKSDKPDKKNPAD